MKFLAFEFIPLMLVPSFILLYLVFTNKSMVERIFEGEILSKLRIDQGVPRSLRIVLLFLALFMMILAMARPVYQKGVIEVSAKQADVVIALDISRSMKAKDLYPDRLTFAKRKIDEFIKDSEGLGIGIIAFAKDAFILSPITGDKTSLRYLLRKLDTKILQLQGTDFMAALKSAKLLFGSHSPKEVLLVTDGGDGSDFAQEIAFAKANKMHVSVLAVGTKKGAPIPEGSGYLKDRNGKIVIVRRNDAVAKLAKATQGSYVVATIGSGDIRKLLERYESLNKGNVTEKIVDQVEFYPYLLALAVLFLFFAFFDIPHKKIAFLLPLVWSMHLHAGLVDFKIIKEAKEAYARGNYKEAARLFEKIATSKQSPQSYYDLGNALYKAGRYEEAIKAYKKVQTSDRELEFKKLYNMGNSYFRIGRYEEAIKMYKKALAIHDDRDAKHNLELAKRMQKRKKKPNEGQQQKKQKKQKSNKGEQKKKDSSNKPDAKQKREHKKSGNPAQKGRSMPKNEPISDREEKKWIKRIEKNDTPTLLFKAPIKVQKEASDENPW